MKDIITIDGPSGAGKSTVSRFLAQKLGYRYLDTGALYRAVAWKINKENINPEDEKTIRDMLEKTSITVNGERIMVDEMDISYQIRTRQISELSSRVSAKPFIREYLYALQREIGLKGKIVIEGRDIGTVIFPEAMNKYFLDAGVEGRGKRRFKELHAKNPSITLEDTINDIRKRDNRDSTRKSSPLKKSADMTYIDTTNLSLEEVITKIMESLRTP